MGLNAEAVHTPRTRVVISSPAHSRSASYNSYRFSKNSVLTVIVFAMLTVIGFTVFNLIATPEFMVKHQLESIVDDYYQNYFYDSVPDHEGLSYYTEHGLANLTLKQLLLYSDRKHADSLDYFSKYCSLDRTSVKIYPEPPFGRKDYHVAYTYSCKF